MAISQTQTTSQVLEAMDYFFGLEACHKLVVNGSAPNSSYILTDYIDENHQVVSAYSWLNEATLGVDPAPAGRTLLQEIAVTDLSDASGTAAEIAAAFASNAYVKASADGAEVLLENKFLGNVTAWADVDTTYTVSVERAGFGGALGAVASGGSTLSTSEEVQDIMSDQTGSIVLDQIQKGINISVEFTLLEMTTQRWEDLIGNVSGANHLSLTGYGTSKLYKSKFSFSGKLVMHPIRLDATDRSADIVIHKTSPIMNSISMSGQDVQGAEFVFSAYKDNSKPNEVNLMSRGDYTLL